MNSHILHEADDHPEPIPASVRALDRLLNARVALAASDAELDRALADKMRIKRRLVVLPDEALEPAARAALRELFHAA